MTQDSKLLNPIQLKEAHSQANSHKQIQDGVIQTMPTDSSITLLKPQNNGIENYSKKALQHTNMSVVGEKEKMFMRQANILNNNKVYNKVQIVGNNPDESLHYMPEKIE